jgi:hypothetical protein
MAGTAGGYHRGDMDIHGQAATYRGFMHLVKWASLAIAVALVFLVLTFCAHAGFFQAAGAAVVLLVLGILGLREKASGGH